MGYTASKTRCSSIFVPSKKFMAAAAKGWVRDRHRLMIGAVHSPQTDHAQAPMDTGARTHKIRTNAATTAARTRGKIQ